MSKRYNQIKEKISVETMPIAEAIKSVKENANAKFDEAVEVHVRLGVDPKKTDQKVRTSVALPHGTGKTTRVAVFTSTKQEDAKSAGADLVGGEDLIAEIASTSKIDFDIAAATPEMMPKMAKIAKILGPKGLMPNPKVGTVTNDIADIVKSLKAGQIEFKSDDSGNVHTLIGKASFETDKLTENFNVFIDALRKAKPDTAKGVFVKTVSVCSTMGPAIKIKL